MKIDMNKKYKTRDGRDVRILCTDASPFYSIIGIVGSDAGEVMRWTNSGTKNLFIVGHHELDLIEVKEKITRWINLYKS